MSYFKDKVVVVTGGTEGIGKAMVEELMGQGAKWLPAHAITIRSIISSLQFANVLFHAQTCDVSNEQDCKKFINSTIKLFGGIDILINNAGISMRALFKDVEMDVMRKVMDINFWGAVYCTRHALPSILQKRKPSSAYHQLPAIEACPEEAAIQLPNTRCKVGLKP